MKQSNPISGIMPDIRRKKADGTFPLKLRVTYRGERKYYGTGYDANKADWELIQTSKAKGDLRKTALSLYEIQSNAQKCCDGLDVFSFSKFETSFFPKTLPIINLQSAYKTYLKQLTDNDQLGTAGSYESACISLHKFKPNLKFQHITPEFLSAYENWFVKNGKSITTVGIYLRSLRAIINMAISEGLMDQKDYPFGKRKYVIPTGKNIKKALTLAEIGKIYNYTAQPGCVDDMCRDYWIFIYLCNGINVKDLCLLKYKDVEGDFIVFNRSKTIRTRRSNPTSIRIALKDDTKRIIAKWGQPKLSPETCIFPHLKGSITAKDVRNTVQLLTHLINEHMKKIATSLEIRKPITTYYARHSFATILKNSGVSTEFIGEALGHSSLSTTKKYLAGFEQDAIKHTTDVLTSFKKGDMEKCAKLKKLCTPLMDEPATLTIQGRSGQTTNIIS